MLVNRSALPGTVTPVTRIHDDVLNRGGRAAECVFAFGNGCGLVNGHRVSCASAQMALSSWPMREPIGSLQAAAA